MENSNFDYLLPELTKKVTKIYLEILSSYPEFKEDIDTSPLLNMTVGIFIGSLVNVLDVIKKMTDGEEKLIKNIELTKKVIIKSIEDLPFISKVEFLKG